MSDVTQANAAVTAAETTEAGSRQALNDARHAAAIAVGEEAEANRKRHMPTITSVVANNGGTATINGINFRGASAVYFGTRQVGFQDEIRDAALRTVSTPDAGVEVTVVTPAGTSAPFMVQ